MFICLWPEFDCPEVTLCGWHDIEIQLLVLCVCVCILLRYVFGVHWPDLLSDNTEVSAVQQPILISL